MNIFSFFAGAGFLDLGFELQGDYNIVFVNEFHEAFDRIYRYARQNMGLQEPKYGHHIEDITEYIDGEHGDRLQRLIDGRRIERRRTYRFYWRPSMSRFFCSRKK